MSPSSLEYLCLEKIGALWTTGCKCDVSKLPLILQMKILRYINDKLTDRFAMLQDWLLTLKRDCDSCDSDDTPPRKKIKLMEWERLVDEDTTSSEDEDENSSDEDILVERGQLFITANASLAKTSLHRSGK